MSKNVTVETKITGYLPITPEDARILEYMTNIGATAYPGYFGSKYTEADYAPVVARILTAARKVLAMETKVKEAIKPPAPTDRSGTLP